MTEFRFERERFKVSPRCPCGKSNKDGKFAPLKDNPKAGKCHSCGEFFYGGKEIDLEPSFKLEPSFMDQNDLAISLEHQSESVFATWLLRKGGEEALRVLKQYKVGFYVKGRSKCAVFWQIDLNQRIRAGKAMAYNSNGKRKKRRLSIFWMHKELNLAGFVLDQCLFGEHLIPNFQGTTVGIVESEKTALVASMHYPKVLWLATGGKGNLKFRPSLLRALKQYRVILYPDAGAYSEWKKTVAKLNFDVDPNIEELYRTGKVQEGYDLADFRLDVANDDNEAGK